MSCPSIWKWKPSYFFSRTKGLGWMFCFYQHIDHNPVIVVQRWSGKWLFQFYHDYFYERMLRKKYGHFD